MAKDHYEESRDQHLLLSCPLCDTGPIVQQSAVREIRIFCPHDHGGTDWIAIDGRRYAEVIAEIESAWKDLVDGYLQANE